jgi:sodium/bile acid cotransporter 7
VALARIANGNVSLALLLTVSTNVLAVWTIPLLLPVVSNGAADSIEFDTLAMTLNLVYVILLPLAAGKLLQLSGRITAFAHQHDQVSARGWPRTGQCNLLTLGAPPVQHAQSLKLFSTLFLVLIPWMKISASRDQVGRAAPLVRSQTPANPRPCRQMGRAGPLGFFWLLVVAIALHGVLLLFNYALGRAVGADQASFRAFVVSCSQKTMGIAVVVIAFLPADSVDPALVMVPVIISHFTQIIVDSLIVGRWGKQPVDSPQALAAGPVADAAVLPSRAGSPPLERDVTERTTATRSVEPLCGVVATPAPAAGTEP